jgi:hemoglobin
MTLYEQLGGAPAVSAALDLFYAKVKTDPQLSPFFAKTDFAALKRKAEAFFAFAAGAPGEFRGPTLGQAHKRFVHQGLNDQVFDRFVKTFESVLVELNVPDGPKGQVMQMLWGARDEVLNRTAAAGV